MPRPRKTPRSVRTARDNARARRLGYKSYYDFRLHDSGRLPPGAEIPPRGGRARLRGHRGPTQFLRQLRTGDILVLPDGLGAVEKDDRGRFVRVDKMVIDGETGATQLFTFRRFTEQRMADLIHAEAARGAVWSPSPSLDQRRLVDRSLRPPPVDARRANRELRKAGLPPWRKRKKGR